MNSEIPQALYEKTLEQMVMVYVNSLSIEEMASKLNAEAMNLLSEIKAILDDDAVEDPACLHLSLIHI